MSAPGTQPARGARDALADLLGLGVPYPLRDLALDFAADVAHGLPTDILIRAAQPGVIYQLCSEEGDPLPGISAQLSADHGGEPTLAVTPVFIPGDLRDAAAFRRELSPGAVGVGALLRRRLQPDTLALLDASPDGSNDAVRSAVLGDLSGIVRQGALYDAHSFADVCLSPWTRQLLAKATRTDTEGTRLNRFLLEDAFPLAIWRTLTLSTPPINADATFTVLASRVQVDAIVETTLTATASVRAGISATLPVQFSSGGSSAMTPYGGLASVAVDGTQEGISYQLFSTQSPPAALSNPQPGNRGFTVTLTTNVPLTQNTGLQVRAFRTSVPATFKFLDTTLQLNVGPNPVRFSPGTDIAAAIPYGGTPAAIAIDQSQASITYQLFSTQNPPVVLSDPHQGNGATVALPVTVALKEDTGVQVKASLTATPATSTFLKNTVQVNVGPDPTVAVLANPPLADYQGSSLFSLVQAQETVRYTLLQRPVAPADYVSPSLGGQSVVATVPSDPAADPPWFRFVGLPVATGGQGGFQITVRVPDLGDGTQAPQGFTVAGVFTVSGGTLQLATAPLQADTLFAVLATKPNGTGLLLNQKLAVLVRPDPQRSLSSAQPSVAKGTPGVVIVSNAQEGVRYRLLNAADGSPVLNPGYPFDARELGTARVGADFAIDTPTDATVPLPTGPLDAPAKFRVVAIKNATSLTAPLNGTISIDVTTLSVGNPLQG